MPTDEFDDFVTEVPTTNKPNGTCIPFEVDGPDDPFSAANFKFEPAMFPGQVALSPEPGKIAIGRPNNFDFVRVHPAVEYQAPAWVLINKESARREKIYHLFGTKAATEAQLNPSIAPMRRQVVLYLSVNRSAQLRIWPIRSAVDDWAVSELAAAQSAMQKWTRILASGTSFHRVVADGPLAEPVWPDQEFRELLRAAFSPGGLMIATLKHPTINALLGLE